MNTTTTKTTACRNGNTIEQWYDWSTRSHVTRLTDGAGNQIGDADFSGTSAGAKWMKAQLLKENDGESFTNSW